MMRVALAVMVGCWILLIPLNAGPDEPSHFIRGAAIVRGDADGTASPLGPSYKKFTLPAWAGQPDPVCYAFDSTAPASCLNDLEYSDGEVVLTARGAAYPIWGQIMSGLGSFAPSPRSAGYAARLLGAVIPVALIGWALAEARRRGPLVLAATLMAVTPMAWFTVSVVNPSGLAIAGGVAFWVGWTSPWNIQVEAETRIRWLVALGWAALVVPRRDGLLWGALALAVVAVVGNESLRDRARWLGRGPVAVMIVSSAAVMWWAYFAESRVSRSLLFTPVILVISELLRVAYWEHLAIRRTSRILAGWSAVLAALVVSWFVIGTRPGGMNRSLVSQVVGSTGSNLREAVGMLGWLDTPLPELVYQGYFLLLGLLIAIVIITGSTRSLAVGGAVLVVGIYTAWVLELFGDNESGNYWQGRYWLPFFVGIPVVLASSVQHRQSYVLRSSRVIAIASVVIVNIALMAAARRWGVGTVGPLAPWRWDTYRAPVPTLVLLIVHAGASTLLLARAWRPDGSGTDRSDIPTPDLGVVGSLAADGRS